MRISREMSPRTPKVGREFRTLIISHVDVGYKLPTTNYQQRAFTFEVPGAKQNGISFQLDTKIPRLPSPVFCLLNDIATTPAGS